MQHRGQVVDPVQGEAAEDCVEGIGGVRELLFGGENIANERDGGVEGEGRVAMEEGAGGVGAGELADAVGEGAGDRLGGVRVGVGAREGARDVAGVRAEVENFGEVPVYVLGCWLSWRLCGADVAGQSGADRAAGMVGGSHQ